MKLTVNTEKALDQAFTLASRLHHDLVTVDHLLWGLMYTPEVQDLFGKSNIPMETFKESLLGIIQSNQSSNNILSGPSLTPALQAVVGRAIALAAQQQKDEANVWMVLLQLLQVEESGSVYLLNKNGIDALAIKRFISHGVAPNSATTGEGFMSSDGTDGTDQMSALQRYGVNLNEKALAQKIDPLIGREYEIQRTAQILGRRRKNNPLLVGEPGTGKTAIAEGLAKMIAENKCPEALKGKQIWSLSMGTMVAGTKYRGDFEQRIKDVLDEALADPNIILLIDEIHTLIGAGGGGNAMDASNIIKPALASGDLRVIGATTFDEYREVFQKEKALDRRFQKVDILEPSPEETVTILKGLKKGLESHHGVKYTRDAIEAAVALSVKYMTDKHLPDKAIDLLDEAGSAEKLKPAKARRHYIDKGLIEETVSRVTRIPVAQVSSSEKEGIKNLAPDLKAVVFGQDNAIDKLSSAITVAKAGLNDGEKPLGSFLFMGPTGVGKTEVTKQLSKSLGIPLLRFDMSEYMEAHSVAKLIGSPPGYVGHDKGGLLTDAVFKNPHAIILLDEIEKAHPDIYNILLQVLDHGTLTDSNGRAVNFKNTLIVMTSNVGATAAARNSIGFIKGDQSGEAVKVMESKFAPEFRNRIDAIVNFSSLGTQEIKRIVDKNIRALEVHLKDKNVTIDVSESVRDDLAREGYVPAMGARPMARLVLEKLKKPLAEKILFGELENGGTVFIDKNPTTGEWDWRIEALPAPVVAEKTKATARKKAKDNLSVPF